MSHCCRMYKSAHPALPPCLVAPHDSLFSAPPIAAGDALNRQNLAAARKERIHRKCAAADGLITSDAVWASKERECSIMVEHACEGPPGLQGLAQQLDDAAAQRAVDEARRQADHEIVLRTIRSSESRNLARLRNAQAALPTHPVARVVTEAGVVPPHYPETVQAVRDMNAPEVMAMLNAYGVPLAHSALEKKAQQWDYLGLPSLG